MKSLLMCKVTCDVSDIFRCEFFHASFLEQFGSFLSYRVLLACEYLLKQFICEAGSVKFDNCHLNVRSDKSCPTRYN